jgi:FxLD family lantipeptide
MSATITVESPATEDPFALDIQVITDTPHGAQGACTNGTDDGCDPTCASACVTGGV